MFCKVKTFCEGAKDVKNVEVEGGNKVCGGTAKLSECGYMSHTCVGVKKTMCRRIWEEFDFCKGISNLSFHLGKTFLASNLKILPCNKVQHHLCKFGYFEGSSTLRFHWQENSALAVKGSNV